MKLPKKPTLNSLKGCTVISPHLREALGINEGVLAGEVKNWNNVNFLIHNYFEHVEDYNLKDVLYNTMLSTLDDLSELKLIDENKKQQKKSGADRLILINDLAIMVPQAKLLMNYCRKISFISTTSGGTYEYQSDSFDKSDSPILAYITSFDELSPITEENLFNLTYMSGNLSIVERLSISGITFVNSTNDSCFLPNALENDVTNMINKFTRAVEYHTKDMLLLPTKVEHINIVSLLNTSFYNNCKESDVCQYNYRYYEAPEQLKNMENDFKIKYVAPFVNAAFDVNDKIVVYWDTPLNLYVNSNMKIQRRQTTDAKFTTIDGIEIGVVEIKPFNTPFEIVEEDRVRLAEISKKMLHKRILAAKSEKELNTFAIMIAGNNIEYFVHEYNPQESTAASRDGINAKYTFRLLKNSILPTFPKTFSHMSILLESLLHYKKMMAKSIASTYDAEKPYLYRDNYKQFEPTVTLLKLNDGYVIPAIEEIPESDPMRIEVVENDLYDNVEMEWHY
ncbi:hypothetical protein CU097_015734 [Rhizopus azygosporus]|uniref:Uncharacterized protein n=2 Tax=Rhizopus TaxID=4842 RepID=A0A367KFS3_RHIAZ|nr:hypothetical protein CU097_015734 [Rhizopus azygosporus]